MLEQALLKAAAAHNGHTLEPIYLEGLQLIDRTHAGAEEKHEEEGEAERGC